MRARTTVVLVLVGCSQGETMRLRPSADDRSIYELAVEGMSCKQGLDDQLDCTYKIGRDLEFIVAGVGEEGAAIVVNHANYDGDYYVVIGRKHGCAIVKPGKKRPVISEKSGIMDVAFISPVTGRAYQTWPLCFTAGATKPMDGTIE